MRVLLSIRPVHAAKILSGEKLFEFRRKPFGRRDVAAALVYCTMPIGRIVCEFAISEILVGPPDHIWRITKNGAGISKAFFDAYFEGRDLAYALKIGEVREFRAPIVPAEMILDFSPPQSFRYLPDSAFVSGNEGLAYPESSYALR